MRLPDSLSDTVRRLLLTPVALFGFASIIATGGGSSSNEFTDDDDEEFAGAITLSPAGVTVKRGQSAIVRVDVEGFPDGEGVNGYTIDLSEQVSRIDITTAACSAGVGTRSCQEWTISPLPDSIPGSYPVEIRGLGVPQGVDSAELSIEVIDTPPVATTATLVTGGLVIDVDGRLWATGLNDRGQAGVGFWSGCDEFDHKHHRCILPARIGDYVQVGSETWIDAATADIVSVAVRSDGTVWAWGDNLHSSLGFDSAIVGEVVIRPRQVPGLQDVTRVSISAEGKEGGLLQSRFLALTEAGTVQVWGRGNVPRLVPLAIDRDTGIETPLDQVAQIAGATDTSDYGFALAARTDGSVWQWGRGKLRLFGFDPRNLPARVGGLPEPIRSIAVGSRFRNGTIDAFALAVGSDGTVWTWDKAEPTPVQIAGLSDIVAVDANLGLGASSALASNGAVWVWQPGRTPSEAVANLPPIASLGRHFAYAAIAADCADGGSLWEFFNDAHRVPTFAASAAAGCPADAQVALSISRRGEGTITSDPAYLTCGSVCEALVPAGAGLKMRATPAPGWELVSPASGDCPINFRLTVRTDTTCNYTFERVVPRTLSVSVAAGGRVVSDPAGIDCPIDCSHNYAASVTSVRLTATAELGYRFGAFSGDADCADGQVGTESARHCNVVFVAFPVPTAPAGLVATPNAQSVDLAWTGVTDGSIVRYQLDRSENGAAFVPLGNLDGTAASYRDEGAVPGRQYTYRLTAINASGSSPPATVTATLQTPVSVTLTVAVTGPGRVTSSPAGIDCGSDCTQSYPQVANVTLSATALPNARFDGWGGACAGTAPSTIVTMDDNKTCTATFTAVSEGGWETLVSQLASSQERDLRSSLVLNDAGSAYVAYSETVGTQNRLTVRQEGAGFPILSTLNANATWSATGFEMALDPTGAPLLIFNKDLQDVMVVRWSGSQWDGLPPSTTPVPPQRMNLTAAGGSRVQIARRGNTLVAAWIEAQQIAMRRYDFVTNQWDSGAFVPGPTNPFDIDLALDTNGLAVIAWTDGLLGSRLHAIRETGPGAWTPLGGDIGVRPATSEMVMEFGIHVDTSNAIRLVWLEGDNGYYVSVAQFDGAAWGPLPGHTNMAYFFHPYPVRSLSVNRNPALFAFAFEWDQNDTVINGLIATRQLVGGQLTMVGRLESTIHPRVGHLSLAMNEADRATIAQSEYTPEDTVAPFKLVIRRHVP